MGRKWKGLTKVGLMAGTEVGADFFRPWRVAKARTDFIEMGVDFILFPGSLLNIDELNLQFIERGGGKKREKKISRKEAKGWPSRKKPRITGPEREAFCRSYLRQILEDVFPPLMVEGEFIKYWVFPCPLFELKRDQFGFAAYIYENLERKSQELSGKDPYIRVGSSSELIEIEDNVAIRTLGVIMPSTSFFRVKILSTPIEREITYRQFSSLRSQIPDLYVAGSFAATINEVNPRTVPMSRPYVSIPSLSIRFTETVLQNTLGYAVLSLYPEQKNRGQYQLSCFPLDDAVELECAYAQRQMQYLRDESQRKVASAIIDKVRIGTKVTIGKIESATGLGREEVINAIQGLKRTHFRVDLDLGEIKNPHRAIPKTKRDLTKYREGVESERTIAGGACFHVPDSSVDYDFLENDLPQILVEDGVETLYIVGDITEGNKYDQDRKGELLDRFSVPQDQKNLAGYLVATRIVLPVFKKRYEASHDVASSILRVVTIPGNHDEVKNEPPLKSYREVLLPAATDSIYEYLVAIGGQEPPVDYYQIKQFVQKRILFLDNPSIDGTVGMLHEYSQSAEQSTGKVQKAVKQFMTLGRGVKTLLLANHHEENFLLLRIGTTTIQAYHLGTLKRFYPFESRRSKISEFGIAIHRERRRGNIAVRIDTKFVPSRIDFDMQQGGEFSERNRIRGITYYEELKTYLEKKGDDASQ